MRDISIVEATEVEQSGPAQTGISGRDDLRLSPDYLARVEIEARRLQGATLARLLGRLFGRKSVASAGQPELRRASDRVARDLGGRAAVGPADAAGTAQKAGSRNVHNSRYDSDLGSSAA